MHIPDTLKMPSLSGVGKRQQVILRNQSTRGMMILCSKKIFQSMGSEYSLRRNLEGKLPDISYSIDLRQTRRVKNIPKTVLQTRLKIKETTYTFISYSTL
jgi:hypothetical protein